MRQALNDASSDVARDEDEMQDRWTSQWRDDMRLRLVARHGKTLERVQRALGCLDARDGGGIPLPDEIEQATAGAAAEMAFHVAEVRTRAARQIAHAVERLTNGTYGVCEWCGKRIPLKRLRLVPHATSCVGCQAEIERECASDNERSMLEEVRDGQLR